MDFVSPVLIAGTILMVVFLCWGLYLNRSSRSESLKAELATVLAENGDPFNGELPDGGRVRVGPANPLLHGRQVDLDLGARKPIARVRVPRKSAQPPKAHAQDGAGRSSATLKEMREEVDSKVKKSRTEARSSLAQISQFRAREEKSNKPPLKIGNARRTDARTGHSLQSNVEPDTLEYTWLVILEKNRERTIKGEELNRLFRRAGLEWDPRGGAFYQIDRRSRDRTFDVINALHPAEFPDSDLEDFVTAGMVVCLELGRVGNPSNAFEMALRFANEAANILPNVEVCDDRRVPLCEQRIQKYRQVLSEFSRERMSVAQSQ